MMVIFCVNFFCFYFFVTNLFDIILIIIRGNLQKIRS
jgi:hypothetical protein